MPPGNQHSGDVLDRALAAARTNPTQTPAGNAFFHAVAGTRSPINRQSSRIAKPFATHAFLGGGTTPTVAPPAQQAFLGRTNATDTNVAKPQRQQGAQIAREYVKAADTQRNVTVPNRTHATVGPYAGGVQGAALTAPDIGATLTRGAQLIGSGIPLGDAARPFISALQKAGLPTDAKQQVIAGFSHDPTLDRPGTRGALVAAALARGNPLPAHPNTRQLLTAAITDEHKPSYWDVISNLPKDLLYTPVYAAQGGLALGHATRAALPTAIGGQGNTQELKAIGESQLSQFEHPGAFIQQHPFQAALMAVGAAKGVGGLAGRVARLPETPRDLTLSNYPESPINRGTLDKNLTVRAAQKLSDLALERGPKRSQGIAWKNRVQSEHTQLVRERAMEDRKAYTEYKNAGKGLKRREKDFLLQNAAQGVTPAEREAFYKSLGETPARSAQAELAGAQSERFGNGPLTPKQQRFVNAARGVAKYRTEANKAAGQLSNEAALRRDYQTLTHVRASQGDATATNILNVEHDLRGWMEKPPPENPELRAFRDQRIQQLSDQHDELIKQFAAEQQGADPFRVPMQKPTVKSQFDYPGKPVRANANLPVSGIGKTRTFGDLLRSGNFTQNHGIFERQLFEPNTAADAHQFVHKVVDPESGLGAVKVENGQPLTELQKQNYTLANRDNLRTKPRNADKTVNAADATNKEAEIVRFSNDLNQAWEAPGLDRVPDDGDFVLVPNPVKAQIDSQVARVRPGSAAHRFQQGTRAFKTGVLMTRPTYPLSNMVQGVGQGAIVGTGATSWIRGLSKDFPIIPGTEDAGFIARDFGHGAQQTARSFLDEGRPIRALAQATIGNYVKGIRNASIAVDNAARRATAAKLAVGEAKKLQGWGKFQRTFRKANDETINLIKKMADGDTPETRAAAERVIKVLNDIQGDYGGMRSNVGVDLAVPFNRWYRFVTKLTLKTLPLNYPGRTLLLYQLGKLGQQSANQQGALPQYLQEPINIAGSPTNRLTGSLARINTLASLGTTFEPTTQGAVDYKGALGFLSPAAQIGYGAVIGKNLETGNALKNAQGHPITSLADRARYLGNQVGGFVPPLGALTGGVRGNADTSIPLPGLVQHLPPKKGVAPPPTGPTVDLPFIGSRPLLPIINQISPVRFDVRNQPQDEAKGFQNLAKALRASFQQEIKDKAKNMTPAQVAALEAKYQKIGAEAQRRQAYYTANPKALAALIASGT